MSSVLQPSEDSSSTGDVLGSNSEICDISLPSSLAGETIRLSAAEPSEEHNDLNHDEMIPKQELQALRSEYELLSSNLALRMELTSELEVQVQNLESRVQAAEEEAQGAAHKLKIALEERNVNADQVGARNSKMPLKG